MFFFSCWLRLLLRRLRGCAPTSGGPPFTHYLTSNRDRYRVRAKRLLVTWSQLPEDWDYEGLPDFLLERLGDTTCSRAGKEWHPTTGGYHVHWFGESKGDFVINNSRELDWCGVHPNIEAVRTTPWIAAAYPLKEGSETLWDEGTPPLPKGGKDTSSRWRHVMNATTEEEFFKLMEQEFPKELIIHHSSVRAYAEWRYRKIDTPYNSPDMVVHDIPQLTSWVQNELRSAKSGRRRSLILYGGSRLGKTLWARSLGPHAYFPGLFMLDGFDGLGVDYAIFDDIKNNFDDIPWWKAWFGCQVEFTATDKYRSKKRIFWGKPTILLANENPLLSMSQEDRDWLALNCDVVHAQTYVCHACDESGKAVIDKGMPACASCDVDNQPPI